MFKTGDKAQVINPVTETNDLVFSDNAAAVLNACKFVGTITQVQNDLYYMTFKNNGVRVTQVYREDEIRKEQ